MAAEEITFGFEQLALCKKVREFKNEISKEARKWSEPGDPKRQINQCATCEGHERFTFADQLHFCIQARGSLSETINHLIDAFDERYITEEQLNCFKEKGKEIERLLNGYINYLRTQRDND